MKRQKYRLAWLFSLLVAVTIACNALSGLQEDVRTTGSTLAAAATDVEESGILETAAAFATEEGSQLVSTAQALATEAEQHGLLETAQAFATEEGSQLLATLEAVATAGIEFGEAPADIPIVASDSIVNFFGSNQLVSYTARLEISEVADFYRREMPANGWEPASQGNSQTDTNVVLRFTKPNKAATITVTVNPLDQYSAVVIFIQPQ